jgi:hypothetical protein
MRNKENYREIQIQMGYNIVNALKELKECVVPACGYFNGIMIYSDDSIDSAYIKIIGETKAEFDAGMKAELDRYEERERKHKEAIPELTEFWVKEGKKILDKKYHEHWAEIVPIRLDDLYRGMELECTLNIVKELNAGCELKTAKAIIEEQGHSGMSFSLVCSMIESFCNRGEEFVNYLNTKE